MDVLRRGEDSEEDNAIEETDADANMAMGATTDTDDHVVRGKRAHTAKPTVPARDGSRKVRMAKRKGPPDSDNDADADTMGAITNADADVVMGEESVADADAMRGRRRLDPGPFHSAGVRDRLSAQDAPTFIATATSRLTANMHAGVAVR
jgi:hypothetical protein